MKKILITAVLIILASLGAVSAEAAWSPKKNEYWIQVNKEQLRLTLYKGNEVQRSWYVSIGKGKGTEKKSRLDFITPAGTYTIYRVIEDASKLVFDPKWFDEEGEPQEGVYGSKLISFYNKWQIAIHGTNAPWSIGRRATHGCIRMRNSDIEELAEYVKPQMKVRIVEKNESRAFYKDTI